jgi:hypothetical protein
MIRREDNSGRGDVSKRMEQTRMKMTVRVRTLGGNRQHNDTKHDTDSVWYTKW